MAFPPILLAADVLTGEPGLLEKESNDIYGYTEEPAAELEAAVQAVSNCQSVFVNAVTGLCR